MKEKVELVMELIEFDSRGSFCGLTKLCRIDDWKQAWKSIEKFCRGIKLVSKFTYAFVASRTFLQLHVRSCSFACVFHSLS
jgi:hypothetical protein